MDEVGLCKKPGCQTNLGLLTSCVVLAWCKKSLNISINVWMNNQNISNRARIIKQRMPEKEWNWKGAYESLETWHHIIKKWSLFGLFPPGVSGKSKDCYCPRHRVNAPGRGGGGGGKQPTAIFVTNACVISVSSDFRTLFGDITSPSLPVINQIFTLHMTHERWMGMWISFRSLSHPDTKISILPHVRTTVSPQRWAVVVEGVRKNAKIQICIKRRLKFFALSSHCWQNTKNARPLCGEICHFGKKPWEIIVWQNGLGTTFSCHGQGNRRLAQSKSPCQLPLNAPVPIPVTRVSMGEGRFDTLG